MKLSESNGYNINILNTLYIYDRSTCQNTNIFILKEAYHDFRFY